MRRRDVLIGGAVAVAGGAGLGFALWLGKGRDWGPWSARETKQPKDTVSPPSAIAEHSSKVYRLGFLTGSGNVPEFRAAFERGLEERGWFVDRNIMIEYRSADGYFDRLPTLCEELVGLGVDLILAVSAPETSAAKRCTNTIPIVFAVHGDPVGTGDVQSLAHPGGNITGMTQTQGDLVSKLLELLREAVPSMSRVATLWNSANEAKLHDWQELKTVAPRFDIAIDSREVRAPADFDAAFAAIRQHRPDALLVFGDPLTVRFRSLIADFAAMERLPAIYAQRQFVDVGGLMSYSADLNELFRLSARHVDKILRGTKPADIPVEQPTKFEFIINLKAANELGLTLPRTLMATADEVIE